jgi:hypothetical protein
MAQRIKVLLLAGQKWGSRSSRQPIYFTGCHSYATSRGCEYKLTSGYLPGHYF